jgi:hypothetical protein
LELIRCAVVQRQEELLLVGEALVHRAARETGLLGDLVDRGLVKAIAAEDHSPGYVRKRTQAEVLLQNNVRIQTMNPHLTKQTPWAFYRR